MQQEMQKLAQVASLFEKEGNIRAGRIITSAMAKIAQTPNLTPAPGIQAGTPLESGAYAIENVLKSMIDRAVSGTDPRAYQCLAQAAATYTGDQSYLQGKMQGVALGKPAVAQNSSQTLTDAEVAGMAGG